MAGPAVVAGPSGGTAVGTGAGANKAAGVKVPKGAKAPKGGPKGPKGPKAPSIPSALAPLSQSQITNRATQALKSAYSPAFNELDQEASQAQAIQDKRVSDNQYYQTWLDNQMSTLQSANDSANQHLTALQGQLQGQQASLYSGEAGVTNPGSINAASLQANQQANQGLLLNSQQGAVSSAMLGNTALSATKANDVAAVQAGQTKENAANQTMMNAIANSRLKLAASEGTGLAKEIARLQGVEVQKAENQQSYMAAAQKLGLMTANTISEINARNQSVNTSAMNAATARGRLNLAQMQDNRNYQLAKQKFGAATAKDLYLRENGLGPYKQSTAGAKKPLSIPSQNAIYNHIDTVTRSLRQLAGIGITGPDAYHALENGYYKLQVKDKTGNMVTKTYKVTTTAGTQVLNAAYNLYTGNGLSPGDVRALEAMGLSNPGSRYSIHQQPGQTTQSVLGHQPH